MYVMMPNMNWKAKYQKYQDADYIASGLRRYMKDHAIFLEFVLLAIEWLVFTGL